MDRVANVPNSREPPRELLPLHAAVFAVFFGRVDVILLVTMSEPIIVL